MSECVQCGKSFSCGMVDADASSPCWCTAVPPLPPALLSRDGASCYCPDCLRALLARAHRDTGVA